ncbi:DNA-3-methyladenine glycosylase family protein [Streptomyces sp. RTd22]|uniref:DNA-3-methyladenine glycosylase family protein n=1 Tax=Streptomyces sp. RTd22 TaxID=1841249 RepID=UPI0007C55A3D|nr:endonuclease III domain-containing protein [Streptomyces sp. RTd22]
MTPRRLKHTDTLQLPVTGSGPFSFRHTLWKPSHYATGLEAHTATRSWRTFRLDDLLLGVTLYATDDGTVTAEVFTDGDYTPEHRDRLRRRLTTSYGLDEDLAPFIELASDVPAMRKPLTALAGMRQSCPEDHFEITVIALLLQNTTIARTTQMTRNLLAHHGHLVHFDGITLRAWFTPAEIAKVTAEEFKERDRLGYRAKTLPHVAAFFRDHGPDDLAAADDLVQLLQQIKGVGPYTAAIMASHASRDPAVFGDDVWNRKILGKRLLGAEDADPEEIKQHITSLFPGHAGTAALYLVEHEYLHTPVVPLLALDAIKTWNQELRTSAC